MEVRCNPHDLRAFYWELKRRRDNITEALEDLKKAFVALDWDDHMAYVTEKILNDHIAAMNTELYRLGAMIKALEELLEETDYYTDYQSTNVSV